MKCFKHPKYKVLRAPISNCWVCRWLFAMKQAETPIAKLNFTRKIRKELTKEMKERWKHRKNLLAIKRTINKGKRKNKIMTKVKTHKLISPSGKIYKTDNLTRFAGRFRNLTRTGLSKIVNRIQSTHKGWKIG